ncbi:MAG: hypothetical protein L6Q57_02910 [Alphaproteobacteria bacterium]|nr:hypothetical protein [Alphaproteobacteria bacterium]
MANNTDTHKNPISEELLADMMAIASTPEGTIPDEEILERIYDQRPKPGQGTAFHRTFLSGIRRDPSVTQHSFDGDAFMRALLPCVPGTTGHKLFLELIRGSAGHLREPSLAIVSDFLVQHYSHADMMSLILKTVEYEKDGKKIASASLLLSMLVDYRSLWLLEQIEKFNRPEDRARWLLEKTFNQGNVSQHIATRHVKDEDPVLAKFFSILASLEPHRQRDVLFTTDGSGDCVYFRLMNWKCALLRKHYDDLDPRAQEILESSRLVYNGELMQMKTSALRDLMGPDDWGCFGGMSKEKAHQQLNSAFPNGFPSPGNGQG